MTTEKSIPGAGAVRRRGIAIIATVVAVAALGYASYFATALRHRESTDDAYVSGNVVQLTPQISGTVVAIRADDTQFVRAGQPLVDLDEADVRVALDEAEADLAKTVREVRNLFATSAQLEATVGVREADLATALQDLARRERLASSGAISNEELQHARDAAQGVKAALAAARNELTAHRARIDGTTVERHPDVLHAAAAVRSAYLNVARTRLPAPVSGYVAKRSVQLGERVNPGTPLLSIVPLDQVWVEANFREAELAHMRVGQPVLLTADVYGRGVRFHGTVEGFGAGTGSAFALLPAQNASGNWIKIVQRVPVRIRLDAREVAQHPLQIGLSMTTVVDTHDQTGARLAPLVATAPSYQTNVFATNDALAETRVQTIIAANEAGPTRTAAIARLAQHPAERAPAAGLLALGATRHAVVMP